MEEDDFESLYECKSCGLLYTIDELWYRTCDACQDEQEFNQIRRM